MSPQLPAATDATPVAWLATHNLLPQPALALRGHLRTEPSAADEAIRFGRAYAHTGAAALAQRVALAHGQGEGKLAMLVLQVATPLGTVRGLDQALDLAARRIARERPPRTIDGAIGGVITQLRAAAPNKVDAGHRSPNPPPRNPLLVLAHDLPDPYATGHAYPPALCQLLSLLAHQCAHVLGRGGESYHLDHDVHVARRFVIRSDVASTAATELTTFDARLRAALRGLSGDDRSALKRVYYGRYRLFRRRETVGADGGAGGDRPRRRGGTRGSPRRGPSRPASRRSTAGHRPAGDQVADDTIVAAARLRPWRGDDHDPLHPPLAIAADGPPPIEHPAGGRGASRPENLTDVILDTNHDALPASVLCDCLGWLTGSAARPEDATTTSLSRWAALGLGLLMGIPPAVAVGAIYTDGPGDDPALLRYDGREHLLYIPADAPLRDALGRGERAIPGYHRPSDRRIVRRPGPALCAALAACEGRARRIVAHSDDAAALSHRLFWVEDGAHGPRPLWHNDLRALCAAYSEHTLPVEPGDFARAYVALALRRDSPAPSVEVPLVCGTAHNHAVPATYLALAQAHLDDGAERLETHVVTISLARERASSDAGAPPTPIAAAWLAAPGHAAIHRALAPRPDLCGSAYRPERECLGAALRAARAEAHRAALARDRARMLTAVRRLLWLELHVFCGVRQQDAPYAELVPGPEGYALIVEMKPDDEGLARPRFLALPTVVRGTAERYLSCAPGLALHKEPDDDILPRADSCRHEITSFAAEQAGEIAAELDLSVAEVTLLVQWWLGHDIRGVTYGRDGHGLERRAAAVMDCVARHLDRALDPRRYDA